MTAIWEIVGGLGGLIRMSVAAVATFLAGFFYVTTWALPAARMQARAGYVQEVTAKAALALADRLQTEITAQQTVIDAYQIQYKNALAKDAAQDAETEKAIAFYANTRTQQGRKCDPLNQSDVDFLLR